MKLDRFLKSICHLIFFLIVMSSVSCFMQARVGSISSESQAISSGPFGMQLSLQYPSTSPNNIPTPQIRITSVKAGQMVKVYLDSNCTLMAGMVTAGGSTADVELGFLVDGSYTFYVKATSPEGSTPCSVASVDYVLDTVASPAPSSVTRLTPSGAIGNITAPVLSIGGVSVGDTIKLFIDSACTMQVGSSIALGTSVDITSLALSDGAYVFYANATDHAGNVSSCSSANAAYTVDTIAPAPPSTVTTPFSPNYQGSFSVTVGGLNVGDTIKIFTDSACSNLSGSLVATASSNNVNVSPALTVEGIYTFYASATDPAGNVSACSTANSSYDFFTDTVVSFANYYQQQDEGGSDLTVQIKMSRTKPYPVQVEVDTSGSTAVSGTHFNLSGTTVTIPAGQTTADLIVSFPNNGASEGLKFLQINIIATDKSYRAIPAQANASRIYIEDDDSLNNAHVLKFSGAYNSGGSKKERTRVCAINVSNKLFCWGDSSNETFYFARVKVGDGTTINRRLPTAVDVANDFSDIQVGTHTACGITTAGYLRCWGENPGNASASSNSPVSVDGATTYSKVFAPQYNYDSTQKSCAITTANKLKCWGSETGDGTSNFRNSPVPIDAANDYSTVAMSRSSTCAITITGVLKCWGVYPGNGSSASVLSPYIVDSGTTYSKIVLDTDGSNHCGITTTGVLKCWGLYFAGDGTSTVKSSPVEIDPGTQYSDIATAGWASCGITTGGQLKCWGNNTSCAIGCASSNYTELAPVVVDNDYLYTKVKMIDMSYTNSSTSTACALTTTGKIKCWGRDNFGSLGQGQSGWSINSPPLGIGPDVQDFGFAGEATFALTASGALLSWGKNTVGQLGTGRAQSVPSEVDPLNNYSKVSFMKDWGGGQFGLTTTGELKCWGNCFTAFYSLRPAVPIKVGSGFSFLSDHGTCAITTTGVLKCWGALVGDGSSGYRFEPTVVSSGTSFSTVVDSSSGYKKCAITTTGALKCWGAYPGDGTTSALAPVTVDSGTSYLKVSVGSAITCGVTSANVLKCWGPNNSGLVGTGFYLDVLSPTTIDAGITYSDVYTHTNMTCAKTTSGTIKCWGVDFVGHGVAGSAITPQNVDGATIYSSLYRYGVQTCGVTSANALRCWGDYGTGYGTNNSSENLSPLVINSGTTYKNNQYAIALAYEYGCGVTNAGPLRCWGSYDGTWFPSWSLGDGIYMGHSPGSIGPTTIDSGTNYQSVYTGYSDSSDGNVVCGITTAGKLKCWGTDFSRVGDIDPKTVPAQRVIGL